MIVKYGKQFLKELARIPSKHRIQIEKFIFKELPGFNNLYQCRKIESLKGYKDFFKVRFGNYRIGLQKEDEVIILKRVLHRKDIYKFFP